jgi:hypothetical protein
MHLYGLSLLGQCYQCALSNCCGHLESKWGAAFAHISSIQSFGAVRVLQGLTVDVGASISSAFTSSGPAVLSSSLKQCHCSSLSVVGNSFLEDLDWTI